MGWKQVAEMDGMEAGSSRYIRYLVSLPCRVT